MNDAFVKSLDPQLVRISQQKFAGHKSIALEPQLPFAQLVEKITQEDITRTHIDGHNLNTNSTLSSSNNNLSYDIDHLTVNDIYAMEHDIADGINVVPHKYSNDPNFKGKPISLTFIKKKVYAQDIAFLHLLKKDTQNHKTQRIFKDRIFKDRTFKKYTKP